MFRREALRDGDSLLVLDLAGEAATTLGVRQLLPLRGKLALGPCHRLLDLGDGDFRVDDGLAHLTRERSQIGGGRRIECGAERVPQALEQGSALADGLGEKVGNDGLHSARLALRAAGTLVGGVLRHRFRAREQLLTRRAAVLVQGHAPTLFPCKTTVKLTHSQPATNWRMLKSAVLAVVIAACGGGLQPEPICAPSLVGLCGTVRFRGAIPDSTDNVFIAAYVTFPQSCADLINNRRPPIPGSPSWLTNPVGTANGPLYRFRGRIQRRTATRHVSLGGGGLEESGQPDAHRPRYRAAARRRLLSRPG